MSHVADGELHAWLDGALAHHAPERASRVAAHLEACGDCRARLEEAREVRDRADEILAAAAPPAAGMPPFEELEERAAAGPDEGGGRAGGPARPRPWGSGPLRGLAWAAALLIGVGLGWAGRAAWEGGGDRGAMAVAERRPALEAPAPERRRAAAADQEGAASFEDRDPGSAGDRAAEREGNEAGADVRAESLRKAEAEDETARDRPAVAPAEETVAEESVAEPPVAEPPVAALEADVAPGEKDAEAAPGEEGGGAAPGEVWIAAAARDAARWIGGRLVVVEGLPVVEVAVSTADGVPVARVRQRLAVGGLVEVHQRPAESEAARREDAQYRREEAERTMIRGAAQAAPAETSAVVDGLRVRLRAPVAPDSLGVLLSRLRPRGP